MKTTMKKLRLLLIVIVLVQVTYSVFGQPCKEIIGYYPNWQWYDRGKLVKPTTINYSKYSIINYCFFKPEASGLISGTDDWADENLLKGQINWSTTPTSYYPNTSIVDLAHNAGTKVMVSIGGWTLSDNFPSIAANATKRATFAGECNRLLEQYKFDGIDIDWEYPGYGEHSGTTADKQNFTIFLQQIRDSINALGVRKNRTYKLSACFGASASNASNIEWSQVSTILDMINVMSYDFFGSWDCVANHNSPLYASGSGDASFNLNAAFTMLTQTYSVPSTKINLGAGFYGRSQMGASTLYGPTNCTGNTALFSEDEGTPLYYNVVKNMSLFNEYWDNQAQVPYLLGKPGTSAAGTFVSYDNKKSIAKKGEYVVNHNARGIIIWELTGDYLETSIGSGIVGSTPLVDTLNTVFCASGVLTAPTITSTIPASRCGSGTVVLNATASAGIISWFTTATGGTAIATGTSFTTPVLTSTTTYYVESNNGGVVSNPRTAIVATVISSVTTPTIAVNGVTTFCQGNSVLLTSSANSGNVWSNGATTQSITVNTSGNYTVTVGPSGCSVTSTVIPVVVNALPSTPSIVANGSTSFCSGGSVQLTSSATSGNIWSTGATTQSIVVTSGGNYSVTVGANGCTSTSSVVPVSVVSIPVTPILTAVGTTTFCQGGSVQLTSSASSGNVWSTGATTQSIIVTSGGNYSVTVGNSGCSATSTVIPVVVNALPSTPSIVSNGSTSFCSGGSVQLTSSATSGNNWSNGETTQSITVTTSGNYSVTASANGCSASSTPISVTVTAIPQTPVITTNGATTFCQGGSVQLSSSSATGNTWSNGSTNQTITLNTGGIYSVTVGFNGCVSTSTAISVQVNPLPVVGLYLNDTLCVNSSPVILNQGTPTGGIYTGSGVSGTIFTPSSSLIGSNTITYSYTNSNNCSNTASSVMVVESCAGMEELFNEYVLIYPNPTKGNITIDTQGELIEAVELFDASGRLIDEFQNEEQSEVINLSYEGLSTGVYTLKLQTKSTILFRTVLAE